MHKSGNSVSFWAAVSMGIGAMVGAGIFSLLGQAGQIAGSAVWISFLLGGIIALLSGYSIGRLGARFPSSGGLVEYLVQGYGEGLFSGTISVLMYISSLVSISLIARTFGTYAFTLLPDGLPNILVEVMAAGVILLFMAVNLRGPGSMARMEKLVVLVKMVALAVFAIAGLVMLDPVRLSPGGYHRLTVYSFRWQLRFLLMKGFALSPMRQRICPTPPKPCRAPFLHLF